MSYGSTHTFKTLDGMRGIAAIAVVLFHFAKMLDLSAFRGGYLAVDLFFCLSGFVIAFAYEGKLLAGMPLGHFTLIRLIRLWPMAAAGIVLGAIIVPFNASSASTWYLVTAFLLNLLMLPALAGPTALLFPFNTAIWSLFFEGVINIAYAALLPRLTTQRIVMAMAIAFVILASRILVKGNANIGWLRSDFLFGMALVTYSFFAGVLLFRFRKQLFHILPAGLAPLVWLFTGCVMFLPPSLELRPYFDCLFILVGAPALVLAGANCEPRKSLLSLATILGAISYPLYALHFPLCKFFSQFAPEGELAAIAFMLVVTAGLSVGSYAVFRIYDEPVRRLLSHHFAVRSNPTQSALKAS